MRAADVDTPFIGGSGVSFLSEPSDDSAMEAARSLIDMRRLRGNLFGHSFFSQGFVLLPDAIMAKPAITKITGHNRPMCQNLNMFNS